MEVSGHLHVLVHLPEGKEPPVSTGWEAEWVDGAVKKIPSPLLVGLKPRPSSW